MYACVWSCQILACVFVAEMQERFCWVIQLFSLVCTVKGYYNRESNDLLNMCRIVILNGSKKLRDVFGNITRIYTVTGKMIFFAHFLTI